MEEQNNILDHLKPRKVETPDARYFSDLADKVVAENQTTKVIPMYKKPIVWITASAAVLAIMFFVNSDSPVTPENTLLALNEIPSDEVYAYIDENIEDFDTDLIAEVITIEHIEAPVQERSVEVISVEKPIEELNNIQTEDILKYLKEQEIDLNDEADELFIDI